MISASGHGASHNNARKASAARLSELPRGGKNLGKIWSPACLPTRSALVTCVEHVFEAEMETRNRKQETRRLLLELSPLLPLLLPLRPLACSSEKTVFAAAKKFATSKNAPLSPLSLPPAAPPSSSGASFPQCYAHATWGVAISAKLTKCTQLPFNPLSTCK